jgi:hypothetical protein
MVLKIQFINLTLVLIAVERKEDQEETFSPVILENMYYLSLIMKKWYTDLGEN